MTEARLRVAAHNAHDQAAAVSAGLQKCDLYLGNEAVIVRRPGWSVAHGGKGVVTAWRTNLFTDTPVSRWHQAHKGSALIPTPARGSLVTDGVLTNGERLRVINGHRQNGTGWPGNKRRNMWRRRRDNWRRHDSLDRRLIEAAHEAGWHVILGADLNREDMPKPHPTAIPLRAGGITQLWYVPPSGRTFARGNHGAIARLAHGTSHRLQWADLNL